MKIFIAKHKCVIAHSLLTVGDKYLDLITWKSHEDKNQAFEDIYKNDAAMKLINLINLINEDTSDEDIPIYSIVKNYT